MRVFLDVSRLLHVAGRSAPSGIDRVELAYARHVLSRPESERCIVAEVPLLGFAALPDGLVRDLVDALSEGWTSGVPKAAPIARRARLMLSLGRRPLVQALSRPGEKALLAVSHRALERPGRIAAMRRRGCFFVPLIHDLIPLRHPEFARPGHAARHQRRITTTAALADAIIVNSGATATELNPWLAARPTPPLVSIAPLGVEPPDVPTPPVALRPYFVVLGTIEPRKNHLLLLNIWRQFANTLGSAAPRLLVVGRRGWENENILDMLERCPGIEGSVRETGPLPDREVASLLRGARALLFPSFAEGFGLPLAEALALGVPVLSSDLPALREVGRDVPDYLDTLDGAAWRAMILEYARADSMARRAQLGRIANWRPTTWSEHFNILENTLDRLARHPVTPAVPTAPQRQRQRVPAMASLGRDEGSL